MRPLYITEDVALIEWSLVSASIEKSLKKKSIHKKAIKDSKDVYQQGQGETGGVGTGTTPDDPKVGKKWHKESSVTARMEETEGAEVVKESAKKKLDKGGEKEAKKPRPTIFGRNPVSMGRQAVSSQTRPILQQRPTAKVGRAGQTGRTARIQSTKPSAPRRSIRKSENQE